MSSQNSNLEHLASFFDLAKHGDGVHRILVDGKNVKYIVARAGAIVGRGRGAYPNVGAVAQHVLSQLPPFPPGDWNHGYISRDPETSTNSFYQTTKMELPGVRDVWHPVRIEFHEVKRIISADPIYHYVAHPQFGTKIAFMKCMNFVGTLSEIEHETMAMKILTAWP